MRALERAHENYYQQGKTQEGPLSGLIAFLMR